MLKSLDGEDQEIFEFLPYLLQDLWELGSDSDLIIKMVQEHIGGHNFNVLDLGCGKGAVSVKLAQATGSRVKGIDALKEFIDFAENKAREYEVSDLCRFEVGDIREAVLRERGYDLVILGAVGDVLGNLDETVDQLKKVVKDNGWIIIDDAFCEEENNETGFSTYQEVRDSFRSNRVDVMGEEIITKEMQQDINESNNRNISKRARELMEKFPEKKEIFAAYIKKQLEECDVLENQVKCAVWLLKNG